MRCGSLERQDWASVMSVPEDENQKQRWASQNTFPSGDSNKAQKFLPSPPNLSENS